MSAAVAALVFVLAAVTLAALVAGWMYATLMIADRLRWPMLASIPVAIIPVLAIIYISAYASISGA